MSTFGILSFSSDESGSVRSDSQQSEISYRSAQHLSGNYKKMSKEIEMEDNGNIGQKSNQNSVFEKILETLQNSISTQALQHQVQIDRMQLEVAELKQMMLQSIEIGSITQLLDCINHLSLITCRCFELGTSNSLLT